MMDRMLFVANSGMERIMQAQTVQMHNLANANTTGFRADLAKVEAQAITGQRQESRVIASTQPIGFNRATGSIETTGDDLDVAITGDGWIGVENSAGSEAMSRNGNFHISPEGLLENSSGHLVLGNGGPITIPEYEKLSIAVDGTISIIPKGQGPEGLAQIDRIRLVNPEIEKIQRSDDGLFYHKEGAELENDPNVRITTGALENSNVSAVETMANILELSRQYEIQVKLMHLAEQNADRATQIMQIEA